MLDEKIDVGEADEQEQEIDLEKPVEEPKEEDKIEVEEAPAEKVEEEKPAEEGKEELSEYSEGVNKRIAKLTRKMREAERQKEEAITYAKGQKETAERMRRRYDSLDTDYNKEFEKRVTTNIDAVKTKLAQAINAGDIEKQVEAQTELSQLTMDATRLARMKEMEEKPVPDHMKPPTGQRQVQPPQQPQRPPDPKADAWAKKNAWFGTDNAMTYTAFDIHKKLVEEEGYDGASDEYYAEVDRRIRLDFPHKFDKKDVSTEQPVQNVASANRPAAKGRRRTVKLTPSQVAISKRLGVPLEEYAKQLTAMEDTA